MEPEKDTPPESESPSSDEESKNESHDETPQDTSEESKDESSSPTEAPADALSRTPDDLEAEKAAETVVDPLAEGEKKLSPIKRILKKVNIYLLIFILVIVVAAAITVVNYLNSQKAPVEPDVSSQVLTEDALKQLANTDASVGANSQTLTIQGNAIISGQTLMRGNLNVAGNIQSSGNLQAPTLTVSGAANIGDAQINSLQVATNTAIQGNTTLRDLNVAGASSFSGAITASKITVTDLILSGNATLEVPNHISFTGPAPTRTITSNVALGSGGTLSINGSDTAGSMNINTGSGTAPGCFARINFNQAFPKQPRVIVSPIGQYAGQTQYYVERSTTGFNICTANAAPANQSFGFDYFVTN